MNIKEIEAIIDFIAKSGLEEVNIETAQIKLTVKRNVPAAQKLSHEVAPNATPALTLPTASMPSPEGHSTAVVNTSSQLTPPNYVKIKSPMIGTFYRSPNPEAAPFVKEGTKIRQGQKICVIEAMKLSNEIEAEISGTIIKVLVEDASPVEYDQPLFIVAPS